VAQIQRIARVTRGVPSHLIRRLYLAVAIPRILYAADVSLVSGHRRRGAGSRAVVSKLASIQRKAALAITGAMRSTATDVLDAHANLLPMSVLIDKIHCRAALRLATLPPSHPLHRHIRSAAKRRVKRHQAPLHGLFHDFGIQPELIEKVDPALADASWDPGFKIRIAASREDAIRMDEEDAAAIQVYTDGSGKDGMVGAAAVLYKNGQRRSAIRYRLGTEDQHTVPEAEGIALVLGLELVRAEAHVRRVSLAADNLGAVSRSGMARASPTQYLWEIFRQRWKMVRKRHRQIRMVVRWVPGHEGVPGNEEADRMAKMAVEKGSSRRSRLPAPLRRPLPRSKQALARSLLAGLKGRAEETWRASPRYARLRAIDQSLPSGKFLQLVEGLGRRKASLLVQLRSGHVPLLAHLFKMKAADSPICAQCGQARETVHHFVLMCPAFNEQRRAMHQEGGRDTRTLGLLLSRRRLIPHLFRYVARTGRFAEAFGV
jgi:ribonuclease HI